jgi:hypothetical protein
MLIFLNLMETRQGALLMISSQLMLVTITPLNVSPSFVVLICRESAKKPVANNARSSLIATSTNNLSALLCRQAKQN